MFIVKHVFTFTSFIRITHIKIINKQDKLITDLLHHFARLVKKENVFIASAQRKVRRFLLQASLNAHSQVFVFS